MSDGNSGDRIDGKRSRQAKPKAMKSTHLSARCWTDLLIDVVRKKRPAKLSVSENVLDSGSEVRKD